MKNLALLLTRLALGTLLAAHGAQKLFGWFGGPGLKNTGGFMESLGLRPGRIWGPMAALGETTGGVLTALGLLSPVGPQNIMAAMTVAARRAHWGKPIWASQGGAELPLTNFAAALALAATGPGSISLDRMLGIRLPKWMVAMSWISSIAITATALLRPELADELVTPLTDLVTPNSVATAPSAGTDPNLEVETRPQSSTRQTAPST